MEEQRPLIMCNLENFLEAEVKRRNPNFTHAICLEISKQIIYENFPYCLDKYLKGEQWKICEQSNNSEWKLE